MRQKHQKYYNRKTALELIRENNYPVNEDEEEETHLPILKLIKPENITFFQWDGDRSTFYFFDHTKENPIVFYFAEYARIGTGYGTFTDVIRSILFLAISNNAATEFTKIYTAHKERDRTPPPPLKCDKQWIMDYIHIYKYKVIDRSLIGKFRTEYLEQNKQREQIENRILTIDEFESGFLNYLKEKGNGF